MRSDLAQFEGYLPTSQIAANISRASALITLLASRSHMGSQVDEWQVPHKCLWWREEAVGRIVRLSAARVRGILSGSGTSAADGIWGTVVPEEDRAGV